MAPDQEESELIEEKIEEAQIEPALKLDYKLQTCAERADLVNQIIERTPAQSLTNRYLEILGDYIMSAITKEEKRAHFYITDNRRMTIDRRETSYEGLVEKFENGEDGIYNIMRNDKNILFQHKQEITPEDIETVPGLKELRAAIDEIEIQSKAATGRRKYLLKKQLIEMRKDQYILKSSYKAPMATVPSIVKGINKIDLSERRYVDEEGNPQSTGLISFFNPAHIAAILSFYNALKIETRGKYQDDFYYLLEAFDGLLQRALAPHPIYTDIVKMKLAGASHNDIRLMLKEKYNQEHTVQFVSSLWCLKIPKVIAEYEQKQFLIWYYNENNLPLKRCSCCKERKPANHHFFSRNKTSKDGFYSQCKQCRQKNLKNKDKLK